MKNLLKFKCNKSKDFDYAKYFSQNMRLADEEVSIMLNFDELGEDEKMLIYEYIDSFPEKRRFGTTLGETKRILTVDLTHFDEVGINADSGELFELQQRRVVFTEKGERAKKQIFDGIREILSTYGIEREI